MRRAQEWSRIALIAIISTACVREVDQAEFGVLVAEACPGDVDAYFFPRNSFSSPNWDGGDLFVRRWYSQSLSAMGEPTLSCGPSGASETYRFLWLRSFHTPVAVRVSRTSEGIELEAVVLDGAGGYEPGQVAQRIRRDVSLQEWRETKTALERLGFWEMTSNIEDGGNDGARWIIEARRNGRYHFVDRWSGAEDVEEVGLRFLELAGLKDQVGPIY